MDADCRPVGIGTEPDQVTVLVDVPQAVDVSGQWAPATDQRIDDGHVVAELADHRVRLVPDRQPARLGTPLQAAGGQPLRRGP